MVTGSFVTSGEVIGVKTALLGSASETILAMLSNFFPTTRLLSFFLPIGPLLLNNTTSLSSDTSILLLINASHFSQEYIEILVLSDHIPMKQIIYSILMPIGSLLKKLES